MSGIVHDGPAVYVNAARDQVVPESSPEAAFLMVGPGGTVDREFHDLYRAHFGITGDADQPAEKPHTIVLGKPHGEATAKPTEATEATEATEVGETGELVDDGDGALADQVVNLDELDREQLLAYADEHGLDVNRRLGEDNLRAAIAEAPLPPAVGGTGEQEDS